MKSQHSVEYPGNYICPDLIYDGKWLSLVVVTVTTTSNGNVLVEFNAFQHCTRYVISKVRVGPKIHNLPEILSFSLEKSEDFR